MFGSDHAAPVTVERPVSARPAVHSRRGFPSSGRRGKLYAANFFFFFFLNMLRVDELVDNGKVGLRLQEAGEI